MPPFLHFWSVQEKMHKTQEKQCSQLKHFCGQTEQFLQETLDYKTMRFLEIVGNTELAKSVVKISLI